MHSMPNLPLSRIRVLDLTRAYAGPSACQMLGDLGAEVIKVERPDGGDEARGYGRAWLKDAEGRATREASSFVAVNRNKKGITADLAKPGGQEVVRKLAAVCDVLVENYKTGDLARYGLDYAGIKAINPRIIYCSVTGFGQTGPYAPRPGYDPVFQAMGGWLALNGETDDSPALVSSNPVDTITGYHAVIGVLAALYERDANGGMGQAIDIALLDVAINAFNQRAQDYLVDGKQPTRRDLKGVSYRCSDGAVIVAAANASQWRAFAQVLGRPELGTDPRFATLPARVANMEILEPMVQAIVGQRSMKELAAALDAAGVPCGPVYNYQQMFEDPQVRHRETVVESVHPLAGKIKLLRNPIRFSGTPITEYRSPPVLGQHTDEVLRDLLGMDEAELKTLRAEGAI